MSTPPSPLPVPVALLGFSSFERSALLARFQRPGHGALVGGCLFEWVLGVDEARFVIADGDQPGALALLEQLGRVEDAVFVGSYAPRRAAAWLMRPLAPDAVLRELAELQRQREIPDSAPLPLPLPWLLGSDFGQLDARAPAAAARPGRRLDDPRANSPAPARQAGGQAGGQTAGQTAGHTAGTAGRSVQAPAAGHAPRPPARAPLVLPRALLVDDSDIALHFLRRLLVPYGLACDVARFSHQALEQLASRSYGLVFLDQDLGEGSRHDGLDLCHRIRHQWQRPGPPPLVVMVSALHDPVHQVRATLAGAQACLGKPLDRDALHQLMRGLGFGAAAARTDRPAAIGPAGPLRPPAPPDR